MIYLNNAASAWPKAPGVAEAVLASLGSMPEHAGRTTRPGSDAAWECRAGLARMLGVEWPERIALTENATHALNLAILGLDLKEGEAVVTSVTEHNSVLRPLARLEDIRGIRLMIVGVDEHGAIDESDLDRALQQSPRLVALNHVSNVTGRVQSVSTLLARARQAGAVALLDASQSLGHLQFKADELNADLIAFTGHKGLRGPAGTGGLYVAPGIELEQVLVGGTGVRSDLRLHPPDMPMRLEAGTPNVSAQAGLAAAIHWHEEYGDAFRATEAARSEQLRAGLRAIPGVHLYGDWPGAPTIGIVSFTIDGWDIEEAGYALAEGFGIACRTGLHCAPLIHAVIGSAPLGTIRFSPSGATTSDEIEYALEAVRRMAR